MPDDIILIPERIYLKDLCQQNNISWQWDSVSQVVTLDIDGVSVKGLVGSEVVLMGGHKVSLSEAIQTENSTVTVPQDFKSRIIDKIREQPVATFKSVKKPLAAQKYPPLQKVREIVIDAGHGGKDPGAIGLDGIQEKDIVLDIAKRLEKILTQRGFKVIMTRKDDEFISLQERTEVASKSEADLFVSIHANSSPARGADGIEVFSLKDLDSMDRDEEQRRLNEEHYFHRMSMEQQDDNLKTILSDMLYTNKQAESSTLANLIVEESANSVKARNRGAKDARFFFLRNTLIPSVLVEVGFVTNPHEGKLLDTISYRQKLAYAIAKGIMNYADGEY